MSTPTKEEFMQAQEAIRKSLAPYGMTNEQRLAALVHFKEWYNCGTQYCSPEYIWCAAMTQGRKQVYENELAALTKERDELVQRALSAEFWQSHAERTNTEFEGDYLKIWKAVKQPNLTVLDSVIAMKKERDELKAKVDAHAKWQSDHQMDVLVDHDKFVRLEKAEKELDRFMRWTPEHTIEQWIEVVSRDCEKAEARAERLEAALRAYAEWHGSCLLCHRDDADLSDPEQAEALAIDDAVNAALAPAETKSV